MTCTRSHSELWPHYITRLQQHLCLWLGPWPWNQIVRAKSCVTSCSLHNSGDLWTISKLQFPHFQTRRKSSPGLMRLLRGREPWKARTAWHMVSAQTRLSLLTLAVSPVARFQLHNHVSAIYHRYNLTGLFY